MHCPGQCGTLLLQLSAAQQPWQASPATTPPHNTSTAAALFHLQGAIPKISDLPAPWGPKPFKAPPEEDLLKGGYLPPRFPEGWSPLTDVDATAA